MRKYVPIIFFLLVNLTTYGALYAQDETPTPTPPIPDSAIELQRDSDQINLAAILLTLGATYDAVICITSMGAGQGFFLPACPEAVLFAALAIAAFLEQDKVDNALSAQLGGPAPCSSAALEQCNKLSKFMAVKKAKDGCHCVSATSPTQMLKNSGVSEYLSDDVKSAFETALETGDLEPLTEALGEYGEYATTDVDALTSMIEEKFENMSDAEIAALAENLNLEPGEEGEPGEEVVDFGGGATAAGRTVPSGVGAQLSPERAAELRKFRNEWKKAAKKKGSGIIANEKREIFIAVERQYDQQEDREFEGSLIVKEGKFVEVKYIPDEDVVKEAVESVDRPKKKKSLEEIIEETRQ